MEPYQDDYLLEPIKVEVKLRQFTPELAFKQMQSLLCVDIKLEKIAI